jgi:hypothetical protein
VTFQSGICFASDKETSKNGGKDISARLPYSTESPLSQSHRMPLSFADRSGRGPPPVGMPIISPWDCFLSLHPDGFGRGGTIVGCKPPRGRPHLKKFIFKEIGTLGAARCGRLSFHVHLFARYNPQHPGVFSVSWLFKFHFHVSTVAYLTMAILVSFLC